MPFRIFSSDLDGTLLGKADGTLTFRRTWESLPPDRRPLLCYNTGRLLHDSLRVIETTDLPSPDYLICGVGTAIYDFGKKSLLKEFSDIMEEGWNKEKIERIVTKNAPAVKQPAHFQNRFKSSWYLQDASSETIDSIRQAIDEEGLEANIVYSSGRDLDLLPRQANKGNALQWLLKYLKIPARETLVAGDTGNDSAMFLLPGVKGILVENAQPELIEAVMNREDIFQAEGVCADGVLEGLLHFGVIAGIPRPEPGTNGQRKFDPEIRQLVLAELKAGISEEDVAYLGLAYDKAVEAVRKNMTPLGFSACSLDDNEVRGTDSNYRSVWARDGSIAVIGTLSLEHDDVRACQRQTLATLLDHISPPGQIPANVGIDSGKPDYSGIGGISSIDSGLWLVIAFYEYVRKTGDLAFLRQRMGALQRAVDWLSAHDSNNDSLLEIPEAGDWTDLFGRSYNILLDEVIWYRTNVCFGRMHELLGNTDRAGDYLRWAQTIKQTILERFWPSTGTGPGQPGETRFADRQFALGDTSYLVAQITPFDFNWRCDVYGNILAFLFNVLDIERAKLAFRFMWGVGINDPYPVTNLYPTVHPGDPDWRSYYTVNLLNLPLHYHNGGIWPFIGAQWVRFIHRLGLRDVALQELLKLARLCQLGVHREWEFNEWAHGKTGRPMGKAYQAWSATEFIAACHDLHLEQMVK